MSEFKYACPVCSQHIRCDSSQAGSTMTCPTCFQKIIVPQAPATEDLKLILTGTKVGDRPSTRNPELNPYANPESRRVPGVLVVLALLLLIGAAVGFVYHGTILEPLLNGNRAGAPSTRTNGPSPATDDGNPSKPTNIAAVAPMADDSNWLLNLQGVAIPDSVAAGRIHGQDFLVERAVFSHGALILRTGRKGPVTFGVTINFNGAQPAALAGKNLNILADTNKSALVTLHWEDDDANARGSYDINYALRLEFGTLANRHLPGRIYLCTPDPQKSYVMGTFDADVPVSKSPSK
jgi:DNA-directed RNA polymerase subunit RPC12/RpoP